MQFQFVEKKLIYSQLFEISAKVYSVKNVSTDVERRLRVSFATFTRSNGLSQLVSIHFAQMECTPITQSVHFSD